ncbi:hypothetical protein BCR33DRAFT_716671 [Rhizoclosmatium globosum]|uniref:Phosphoglycerate mutase-like protein n=1 Tax=Rhizoclosmatium globosum TaxID=329046 RepID=A0A1Y2CCD6_9FUNG|nr:hypothetical protein BCR33DRAFT_716671 [Rhizoclosmatium globosum]|eukprot:ORY44698.1 hypothetical protein BCR33DRAFT_716671 [Rhizoclosmatium globosum]
MMTTQGRTRTVIFVRHGTRQDFLPTQEAPTKFSLLDSPLSSSGIAESQCLGAHLATILNDSATILSSPLSRCIQTILPLSQQLKVPIKTEAGVGEWLEAAGGACTGTID